MKIRLWSRVLAAGTLVLLAVGFSTTAVSAHQLQTVGNYNMEVGFFIEPALEDQANGIDLTVTNNVTNQPVTGLESTLQVDITCVADNISKVFSIEPVDPDSDPGHYNNGFIPTVPGTYSFRFFGTIDGTAINETFTSGPNTFSDVLPATDYQFPVVLPSLAELDGVATAAQSASQGASNSASTATTLAYVGMGFGIIGTAIGVVSLLMVRKKNKIG